MKKVTRGRTEKRFIEPGDNEERDAFYRDYTGAFKGDDLKKAIIYLHNQGKTQREIAYYHGLGCSKTYVHQVITNYKLFSGHKEKMRKRNKINEKGHDSDRNFPLYEGGFFERWK